MKHCLPTALIALGLASAPLAGLAAEAAPGGRIRDVDYDPAAVYRIAGADRMATQIVFAPDETIRHVALGDSAAWEVAAEGSVLFLKPRERAAATNLLVVTDRGGTPRHYVFELSAAEARRASAYQIRFRYPADVQARALATIAAAEAAVESRLVGLALQQGAIEGPRNLAYSVQGSVDLQPSEVTDNGRFTVLRFPGGQAIPAIFAVAEDGGERLVPFDVRGEFVVIHSVERGLRLRRGGQVLCIYNDAFDARGATTGTLTATPRVERAPAGGRP